jgi:hypothetical protein
VPSDPTQQFSNNCVREGRGYLVVLRACFQSSWCTWQQTPAVGKQILEASLAAGQSWLLYFTVIPRWWGLLLAKTGVVTYYLTLHCWNSLLFKDLTCIMSEFFTLHSTSHGHLTCRHWKRGSKIPWVGICFSSSQVPSVAQSRTFSCLSVKRFQRLACHQGEVFVTLNSNTWLKVEGNELFHNQICYNVTKVT